MFNEDKEHGCVVFSTTFLVVINLLTAVCGLVIAGAATYFYINAIGLFSDDAIWIAMAAGVLIFLFSFVGIYGAFKKEKKALIAYGSVVALAMIGEIALLVILVSYISSLGDLEEDDSSDLTSSTEIFFNDFIFSSFNQCCDEYCVGEFPGDDFYCTKIADCGATNSTSESCFVNGEITIQQAFCDLLEQAGLVGQFQTTSDSQCGGGDAIIYQEFFLDFIRVNASVIYYIFGFTFAIELLAVVFVAVIIHQTNVARVQAIRSRDYTSSFNLDATNSVVHYERPESLAGSSRSVNPSYRMSVRDSVRMSARDSLVRNSARVASPSVGSVTDAETGLQIAQPVDDFDD